MNQKSGPPRPLYILTGCTLAVCIAILAILILRKDTEQPTTPIATEAAIASTAAMVDDVLVTDPEDTATSTTAAPPDGMADSEGLLTQGNKSRLTEVISVLPLWQELLTLTEEQKWQIADSILVSLSDSHDHPWLKEALGYRVEEESFPSLFGLDDNRRQATYVSVEAEALNRLLNDVLGWSLTIPSVPQAYGDVVSSHGRIYLYEYGCIVSLEGISYDYGETVFQPSGEQLSTTTPYHYGEEGMAGESTLRLGWTAAPDSLVGFRLRGYQMETSGDEGSQSPSDLAGGAPEAACQDAPSVEQEVLRIRGIYQEIKTNQGYYEKNHLENGSTLYSSPDGLSAATFPRGTDGNPWAREYYYEGSQLIFAFYFQGTTEHRFYFLDGRMFRWIDDAKEVHDYDYSNPSWSTWESQVLQEADR